MTARPLYAADGAALLVAGRRLKGYDVCSSQDRRGIAEMKRCLFIAARVSADGNSAEARRGPARGARALSYVSIRLDTLPSMATAIALYGSRSGSATCRRTENRS